MTEIGFLFRDRAGDRRLADDRGRFWHLVRETLVHVFHVDARDESWQSYRRTIEEEASPGERIAVYHCSPLQIAADLAGVVDRPISEAEQARYLDLQRTSLAAAGIDTD